MQTFIQGSRYFSNATGMNFSVLYIDSCSLAEQTSEVLSKIFDGQTIHPVDIWGRKHSFHVENLLMIIGDELSSVTLKLHDHFGHFGIPVLSSGCSSHWLDNIYRYPEVLRSTLSSRRAVPIALQACRRLNITSLVLLYSNTPHGKSALENFTDTAEAYHVCVQETIILEEYSTMIQGIGQRLASEAFVPRVFLLFAEDLITKLLVNAIATKDVLWTETGRIMITESDLLTMLSCDLIPKFLGSIRVHSMLPKSSGFQPDVDSFDEKETFYNKWYAQYWQQQGECYLPNMAHMPTSFSLPFPKKCTFVGGVTELHYSGGRCGSIDEHTTDSLVINDPIVETTYASWKSLAHAILSTPRNTQTTLFKNRTLLMHKLLLNNISLFDPTTHQGHSISFSVSNLNKFTRQNHLQYTEIFKVPLQQLRHINPHVELVKTHDPIYYRHGEVDNYFQSKCSPLSCPCLFINRKDAKALITDQTTKGSSDKNVMNSPGYKTMAAFLALFALATTGVVLYVVYKPLRNKLLKPKRPEKSKRYKSKNITSIISYISSLIPTSGQPLS